MKFNWRSFVFSLGVLLFALIAVNLMASGVKLEGFEEGAVDAKSECQKKVAKINDFEKAVKDLQSKGQLYKDNKVDYSKLSAYGKPDIIGGACAGYISKLAPIAQVAKQVAKQVEQDKNEKVANQAKAQVKQASAAVSNAAKKKK